MSFTIFAGNLNFNTSENDLRNLILPFGEVVSIKLIKDKYTFRSKGFAYIEVTDEKIGYRIIETLSGQILNDRPLRIESYKPNND